MNETRKEIISLISDYMYKTLSEGCLIGTGITRDIIWEIIGEEYNHYSNQYKVSNLLDTRNNVIIQSQIKNHKYIYGHYELSALLKTIQSFGLMLVGFDGDYINFYSEANSKNYRILNKPLSLYNENEEKELLDLLLKLKNDLK